MPEALIHHLTSPGDLTASTVACGARDAALATWALHRVTCPACQRQCTCGPGVPVCPACRAYQAQRRRRAPPLPRITSERAFQEVLRQACAAGGFLWYHAHTSLRSPAGFPDLVAVRGPQLVFAELKMPGKRPTAAQQAWLDALAQVEHVATFLWTPADLPAILEVLQ